jgi:hypothetical protein
VVHVLSEERPEEGFEPASVTLEDVFFTRIGDEAGVPSGVGG